jgi:MFS family permease
MIATSLTVLFKFVTLTLWGELGDRYGNKKILVLASLFIAVLPFLWIVNRNFWWICLIQVFGGMAWAGFDISVLNFAFDVLPSEKVTRHTSYLLFYRGLATFVGGLIGGFLFHRFLFFESPYHGNFFLSGVLRVLIAVPFLFFLKEERSVEHISYRDLMFKLMSVGPRRGLQLFLIGRAKKPTKEGSEEPPK